jgi:hypothetical protein
MSCVRYWDGNYVRYRFLMDLWARYEGRTSVIRNLAVVSLVTLSNCLGELDGIEVKCVESLKLMGDQVFLNAPSTILSSILCTSLY